VSRNGNGSAATNGNGNGSVGVTFESFTETFSQVPTAVTVVTTKNGDDSAHGTTVSAFCSLSIDPPLLLVALDRSSDLLKLLRKTRRFGVNLLSGDQEDVGVTCAKKGSDKFRAVSWTDEHGLPRIEGAAAWLECDVQKLLPGGDHVIVVGLVTACETGEAEPLVYHRRRFLQLT
jgi:flavin reductase (DIM6/NTAB) family NADH-FMN oxidoreductase RutF